jgi:hypothetical protein
MNQEQQKQAYVKRLVWHLNTAFIMGRRFLAIFMAATLVVGTFATATTQTAFAFSKNKKGDENSKNGNTTEMPK